MDEGTLCIPQPTSASISGHGKFTLCSHLLVSSVVKFDRCVARVGHWVTPPSDELRPSRYIITLILRSLAFGQQPLVLRCRLSNSRRLTWHSTVFKQSVYSEVVAAVKALPDVWIYHAHSESQNTADQTTQGSFERYFNSPHWALQSITIFGLCSTTQTPLK